MFFTMSSFFVKSFKNISFFVLKIERFENEKKGNFEMKKIEIDLSPD